MDAISAEEGHDVKEVDIKSSIQVKGKNWSIRIIVPVGNNNAWISETGQENLTLIDSYGSVIGESASLTNCVVCATNYNTQLLLTCYQEQNIFLMSEDGKKFSNFSDMSPLYPRGLDVTSEMEVLVCVTNSSEMKNNSIGKVVRLNKDGHILQCLQFDQSGQPMFTDPYNVTSLTSGEIVVVEYDANVVCLDKDGRHVFTWSGEIDGEKTGQLKARNVSRDRYDNVFITDCKNNKLYVIKKNGTGATCLLNDTDGIKLPRGMVIDSSGQTLICAARGHIHVLHVQYFM